MICPKCGTENKDTYHFCDRCGFYFDEPIQKTTVNKPSVALILFGLFIILAMYTLPIIPSQTLYGKSTTTLANTIQSCASPFVRCPEIISWIFFVGWGLGILLIVIGIFNKKEI